MTLDEQKLAICEKLPELFRCGQYVPYGADGSFKQSYFKLKNDRGERDLVWPTEGLQVCHEAENKLLIGCGGVLKREWQEIIENIATLAGTSAECATYEQRLEALCRVLFPERFGSPKSK